MDTGKILEEQNRQQIKPDNFADVNQLANNEIERNGFEVIEYDSQLLDESSLSERQKAMPNWSKNYSKVFYSYNPAFMDYMKALRATENDGQEDSAYMKAVRAAAENLINAEKSVISSNNPKAFYQVVLPAKTKFVDKCNNYLHERSRNLFRSKKGKHRKSIVQGLYDITRVNSETQSTRSIELLITKNDEHKAYQKSKDAPFLKFQLAYKIYKNAHKQFLKNPTKAQKKIMSLADEFYMLCESQASQNDLSVKAQELLQYMVENKNQFKGPFESMYMSLERSLKDMQQTNLTVPENDENAVYVNYDEAKENELIEHKSELHWKDVSNQPIFAGGINYSDIRQGGLGDCYMLATLGTYAKNHPQIIRDCIKDNGNGTATVRFFSRDAYKFSKEKYVNVENFANVSYERQMTTGLYRISERINSRYEQLNPVFESANSKYQEEKEKLQKLIDAKAQNEAIEAQKASVKAYEAFVNKYKLEIKIFRTVKDRLKALNLDWENLSRNTFDFTSLEKLAKKIIQRDQGKAPDKCTFGVDDQTIASAIANKKATVDSLCEKMRDALANLPEEEFKKLKEDCKDEINAMTNTVSAFRTRYVTVSKKIVVSNKREAFSRGALWTQLLEKAYARSGIKEFNERFDEKTGKFSDANTQEIYENLKKRYPKDVNQTDKAYHEFILNKMKNSFMRIEGGSGDVFAEHLTGQVHITNRYSQNQILARGFNKKDEHGETRLENCVKLFSKYFEAKFTNPRELRAIPNVSDAVYTMLEGNCSKCIDAIMKKMSGDKDHAAEIQQMTIELVLEKYQELCEKEIKEKFKDNVEAYPALKLYMTYMKQWLTEETLPNNMIICHSEYATKTDERGRTVGDYTSQTMEQFNKMKSYIDEGKPIQCGSNTFEAQAVSLNGEPYSGGFIGNHVYSIIDVDDKQNDGFLYVILYNPHHRNIQATMCKTSVSGKREYTHYAGGTDERLDNAEASGTFRMELNEFMMRCNEIYY